MMTNLQETDSKYRDPITYLYKRPIEIANETFGGGLRTRYHALSTEFDLLTPARRLTRRIQNENIRADAQQLLLDIQEALARLEQLQGELAHLPELEGFLSDDGSAIFEWSQDNYRVGFSIEENTEESGWYLITDRALGKIRASGFITRRNINIIIPMLLYFMIGHS